MSNKVRIHQYLSQTGKFKTKAEIYEALKNSQIKVDGRITTTPHFQLNPRTRVVTWNDEVLGAIEAKIYIILNKPEGYLSAKLARVDKENHKNTIYDLINIDEKLTHIQKNCIFTVGRLDEDTSGLIILTNDGKLGAKITQPESEVEKTYEALLEKPLTPEDVQEIEEGITIELEENGKTESYRTKPCKIIPDPKTPRVVQIKVTEGKKREVRRMFESVGNTVIKLKRIAIGQITLADLQIKPGAYKFVEKEFLESNLK